MAHHANRARRIHHVHHRLAVSGRDLHRRMRAAGGRASNQQRHLESLALHFARHVYHLVERRRNQAAQAHQVHLPFARHLQNLFCRHHDAQVNQFIVVAGQYHAHDVLTNIVYVTLHRGHQDAGHGLPPAQRQLFRFQIGQQNGHGLLHHPRGLHHLRQEHLAGTEQVAHDVHAVHQRAFDDAQRAGIFQARLFHVHGDMLGDTVHQRVRQALLDCALTPGGILARRGGAALLDGLRELEQPLGRIGPAIEQHVFDALAQLGANVLVYGQLAGVDDAHINSRAHGVIKKRRVHGLADHVVAAEGEREVRDAAADFRARQSGLNLARGLQKRHGVLVVLLHAGGHGEDGGIENNVGGRHAHFLGENAISAVGDGHFALGGVGLALLVKRHDDDARTVAPNLAGLLAKNVFAFFQADGVDDALPLQALQAGFDDAPARAIHHDGHAGDVGLGADGVQERGHGLLGVQHGLVHVHVNHLRAAFDLLPRDGQRFFVVPLAN